MIRIFPLFLALLMLVGSVGVTVSRHFCMGEMKSLTLFGKSDVCEMAVAEKPVCPLHASPEKKGCCDDEYELVKWDNDRQLADAPALPAIAWALTAPTPPAFPEFALHLRARPNKTFQHYRPPPIIIDVPRRFQVFRI
ncbi:hypothetical protein GGR28_002019 [Lewinella aquimaris]|uniref:Uncharacterized protein n=1 Tax=Neolewinella aquimaris TaxID=1835722 RepID=A0A840EC73_9BACT|nr:hypothetical protein [Neolewinella aquimaris]MBB4079399.1 hypothetical protein [Neolewinella aquimaris]